MNTLNTVPTVDYLGGALDDDLETLLEHGVGYLLDWKKQQSLYQLKEHLIQHRSRCKKQIGPRRGWYFDSHLKHINRLVAEVDRRLRADDDSPLKAM